MHYDDVRLGMTLAFPFTTNDGSGGAVGFSATIEVADFDVYRQGDGATQRTSTAGFTINETFDTVTGAHVLEVDTDDNTDADFYEPGGIYFVLMTPDETVDSQTVAKVIGSFKLKDNWAGGSAAGTPTSTVIDLGTYAPPTTNDRVNGMTFIDHTNRQSAIVDDYNATSGEVTVSPALPTTPANTIEWELVPTARASTLSGGISDDLDTLLARLTSARAGYLDNLNGHTAQTGDSFARLGAPAGASVSADIAAIENQTDDIGVAGAGLTAVPWNAAWDAEVQSEVEDALAAARSELGAVPAANASLIDKITWLAMLCRNELQNDGSSQALRDDGDTTDVATAAVTEAAGTVTRGEWT